METLTAPDLTIRCNEPECSTPHCSACKRRHVDGTVACVACLNRCRENLDALLDHAEDLGREALEGSDRRGRLKAAGAQPGGLALMLTGQYVDHETRRNRIDSIDAGRIVGSADDVDGGVEGPVEFLAGWALAIREERGLDDLCPTRVGDHLTWAAAEWNGFAAFASALHAQVRMLEGVLGIGERPVVSGVPCPSCEGVMHVTVGSVAMLDGLECPRFGCGEWLPADRGQDHVRTLITEQHTEGWVTVKDAAAVVGRSEQTLHTWTQSGAVATRTDSRGRKTVQWADVLREDALKPRRQRGAKVS